MRLALFSLLAASALAAQPSVTYEVTFASTWSAATHPDGFPPGPHFSPLIGAAHADDVVLWEAGQTATGGIEAMAETGATSALRAEIEAHALAGRAAQVLSGDGLGVSPGSTAMTIDLDAGAPLVTLVTMLAPSPDWFVGVDRLDLRDGDGWVTERTVDLYVYDAGSDDGATYTSADADADPKRPIARIEAPPFFQGATAAPVGTFTFRLSTATSGPQPPEAVAALRVLPNPVTAGRAMLRLGGAMQTATVRILDVRGREVFATSLPVPAGGVDVPVTTSGWAPGVYMVRVESAQGVDVAPMTVVR